MMGWGERVVWGGGMRIIFSLLGWGDRAAVDNRDEPEDLPLAPWH